MNYHKFQKLPSTSQLAVTAAACKNVLGVGDECMSLHCNKSKAASQSFYQYHRQAKKLEDDCMQLRNLMNIRVGKLSVQMICTYLHQNTYVQNFETFSELTKLCCAWQTSVKMAEVRQKNDRGSSISLIKVLKCDPALRLRDPTAAGPDCMGVFWWLILTNICHFFDKWFVKIASHSVHPNTKPNGSLHWTNLCIRPYLSLNFCDRGMYSDGCGQNQFCLIPAGYGIGKGLKQIIGKLKLWHENIKIPET